MIAALTRIIVAVVTLSFMISGNYYDDFTVDYFKRLGSIDIYENSTVTAIPAKNVYDIIEDHFSSELPEGKKVKKAVFIGYDAVRADILGALDTHGESAINAILQDGGHAFLSYAGGINFPYYNIQSTDSGPGWNSMITGELFYKTGVLWNEYEKSDKYPSLLKSLIDNDLADKTSVYTAYGGLVNTVLKREAESTAADGYDASYVDAARYNENPDDCVQTDMLVTRLAVSDISSQDCSDFIFALYNCADEGGHAGGFHPDSKPYMDAFEFVDGIAEPLIDSIKARPTYDEEDWLFLVSSDHGGFNHSHGYCTAMERYTFIVANKDISRYFLFG